MKRLLLLSALTLLTLQSKRPEQTIIEGIVEVRPGGQFQINFPEPENYDPIQDSCRNKLLYTEFKANPKITRKLPANHPKSPLYAAPKLSDGEVTFHRKGYSTLRYQIIVMPDPIGR